MNQTIKQVTVTTFDGRIIAEMLGLSRSENAGNKTGQLSGMITAA